MLRTTYRRIKHRLGGTVERQGIADVVPVVPLGSLLKSEPDVSLAKINFIDGNVSPLEILALASLAAEHKPRTILEIGTFNGNTTLQLAMNAPAGSQVLTLDLPQGESATAQALDEADVKYVLSQDRQRRRFIGTPAASKIRELWGDSATFDFSAALAGHGVDLAFIDGSHSFDYVKSDTERVLKLLSPGGVILWHDYQPYWHGVCQYLNTLSKTLPLQRIDGTCLVCYRSASRSVA